MEKYILDNELTLVTDWRTKIAFSINKQSAHIVKKMSDEQLALWTSLFNKLMTLTS